MRHQPRSRSESNVTPQDPCQDFWAATRVYHNWSLTGHALLRAEFIFISINTLFFLWSFWFLNFSAWSLGLLEPTFWLWPCMWCHPTPANAFVASHPQPHQANCTFKQVSCNDRWRLDAASLSPSHSCEVLYNYPQNLPDSRRIQTPNQSYKHDYHRISHRRKARVFTSCRNSDREAGALYDEHPNPPMKLSNCSCQISSASSFHNK
jgi:hypothetical protein